MGTTVTGMEAVRVRGTQYKNRLYCWNGANRMRNFDGVNWSNAGIDKPTATPAVAEWVEGTGLYGPYRYYYTAVNSKHFDPTGRPIESLPSPISAAITVSNKGITVSSIPATHADSQVDKFYIYRNRSGYYSSGTENSAQAFYKVGEVAVGTTTYNDTTSDDSLTSLEQLRFNTNVPPAFKHGFIFGDRLFGFGFDPITSGTATVSATNTIVNLTGASLPDGVPGAWFQKSGDDALYRIMSRGSATQITLDRAYSGSMSDANYRIFRYPWDIYFSEQYNFEAWGLDSEGFRNRIELPGWSEAKAGIPYQGKALIFSYLGIYAITGIGPERDNIKISPEPLYYGLGCVGGDALCMVDNTIYFMSNRGPAMLQGGSAPKLIGNNLLTDWLDSLDATEQSLIQVYSNGTYVWFAYPLAGHTENSLCWRYDTTTGDWHQEDGAYVTFGFNDDGDDGVQGRAYVAMGKRILQVDEGTTDVLTSSYTGTVTTGGTTGLTDSTASFPTTNGGCTDAVVHIFNSLNVYQGSRRVVTNTATSLTWASSGAGGGTLTVSAGYIYVMGGVYWRWKTRAMIVPSHAHREIDLIAGFGTKSDSQVLRKQDYFDGTASSNVHTATANKLTQRMTANLGCEEYSALLESYTGASLRYAALDVSVKGNNKP